jgi:tripartite-type tricarboxylate transporter receptor subunit TctC
MRKRVLLAFALAGSVATAPSAQAAQSAQFYAGKQIELIVGAGTGGGNDLYARVLAQFLPRHIPGRPTIVVQNMVGSEGVNATSYIYNAAPADGTVIATTPASMVLAELLDRVGGRFSSQKLAWIGTVATTTDVLAVFRSTGLISWKDAKAHPVRIGASGGYSLSAMEPEITNALLGTKFEIVKGYTGGGEAMNLAMAQHEIDGRTNQWDSWKALRPEWIAGKQLSYMLQYGPKDPTVPGDTPSLDDLISDSNQKAIVNLLEVPQFIGRSFFAPPSVPRERLQILREAFDQTMIDPDFIARMKALRLDLDSRKANDIYNVLAKAFAGRGQAVRAVNAMIGSKADGG